MSLHSTAFEYLMPTDRQTLAMADARYAFKTLAQRLDLLLPDGPDKTYTLRKLREVAMWANVAITRHPDGSPRTLTDEITP